MEGGLVDGSWVNRLTRQLDLSSLSPSTSSPQRLRRASWSPIYRVWCMYVRTCKEASLGRLRWELCHFRHRHTQTLIVQCVGLPIEIAASWMRPLEVPICLYDTAGYPICFSFPPRHVSVGGLESQIPSLHAMFVCRAVR